MLKFFLINSRCSNKYKMSELELQEEEREVLASIYDGDNSFKQVSPTTYQYKYGEIEEKSFLLEIIWGPNYPTEPPTFNLDTFYNRNILQSIKNSVLELVTEESQQWLGCAMTYTIFEALKEKIHELLEKQSEANDPNEVTEMVQEVKISDSLDDVKKNVVKKSQLTKAQKRRQWERTDGKGEKPRGWDWVDIVKHLSQTGSKDDGAVS
ncbi:RWD domain-containing protein 4 [Ctenocephalides felis]|uniref:RWD domain-containing protein 4 n=1 Tax=Ctenocephalides felis TaxID=7515 RepID=UPI000E6E13CD|nr:RWD domain-containing protein 4 [Ctenocephalides felis]